MHNNVIIEHNLSILGRFYKNVGFYLEVWGEGKQYNLD